MARKLPNQKNAENLRHGAKLAHSLSSHPRHQIRSGEIRRGGKTKAIRKKDEITKASPFKKPK